MPSIKEIETLSSKYTHDVINTTEKLVKTASVYGIDPTDTITKQIATIATNLGFESEVIASTDEIDGVFVGSKEDFFDANSYLISTGYSTVALEEGIESSHDPFTPTKEGNKLYGSGAWKNKGNVALTLYVKKILTDLGYPNLVKMIYSHETGHNSYSALKKIYKDGAKAKLHLVSCPVSFDDSNKALLYTGCRGFMKYQVSVKKITPDNLPDNWTKKQTHISNAITALIKYWDDMQQVFGDNPPHPSYPAGTTNNQEIFSIHGGTGDAIPSIAIALVNVRTVAGTSFEEYMEVAHAIANLISQDHPFEFSFEIIEDIPAAEVVPNNFYNVYTKNLHSVMNFDSVMIHDYYADGIYYPLKHNTPVAYAISLTGKNQNSFDEYLDIGDIDKYLTLVVKSILENEGIEVTL